MELAIRASNALAYGSVVVCFADIAHEKAKAATIVITTLCLLPFLCVEVAAHQMKCWLCNTFTIAFRRFQIGFINTNYCH